MRYATATLSALFIFICSGLMFGILLAMICPKTWFGVELDLGLLSANIPSLITLVIASAAATHTFRASLRARAFKLYRNKTKELKTKEYSGRTQSFESSGFKNGARQSLLQRDRIP